MCQWKSPTCQRFMKIILLFISCVRRRWQIIILDVLNIITFQNPLSIQIYHWEQFFHSPAQFGFWHIRGFFVTTTICTSHMILTTFSILHLLYSILILLLRGIKSFKLSFCVTIISIIREPLSVISCKETVINTSEKLPQYVCAILGKTNLF